jgi:hypothetical protein
MVAHQHSTFTHSQRILPATNIGMLRRIIPTPTPYDPFGLDEQLPSRSYSLKEFADEGMRLHALEDDDGSKFCEFVATGRHPEELHQVALLPDLDEPNHRDISITVMRDYDSLLGVSKDLPYNKNLEVFPVASWHDTLKTRVSLKVLTVVDDGLVSDATSIKTI